ncbi:MAG: hypothetical protein KC613_02430, partial [Myxococcales bacterium]|nr:hypothetical protein [Myxococcales bacterium]
MLMRLAAVAAFFVLPSLAFAQGGGFEVVSVPWVGSDPGVPHDAVAGEFHYLQAVARNCNGAVDFRWDVDGDGTWDTPWAQAPDRWNLGLQHTYPANMGASALYVARVQGRCGLTTDTAEFPVFVRVEPSKAQRVNRLISNGLWYGHTQLAHDVATQQARWRERVDTAAFGLALLRRGHRPTFDPRVDPYAEDLRWMAHYVISGLEARPIAAQGGGVDPDSNGNGVGYRFAGEENYASGPQLEMLAALEDLDYAVPANVGAPAFLVGRPMGDVIRDGVDYFLWAQSEIPFGNEFAGGWDYQPNAELIDSSQVGWAAAAVLEAEQSAQIAIPDWAKRRLAVGTQFMSAERANPLLRGGYGYRGFDNCGASPARSGSVLSALALATSRDDADQQVQDTLAFLSDSFEQGPASDCWGAQNLGSYYAMYLISRGLRAFRPQIDRLGEIDWYDRYVDFLLPSANAQGRFENDQRWTGAREITHSLGLLILIPSSFDAPPVAIARAVPTRVGPGDRVVFNHAESYHPDPNARIVTYRWNFIDFPQGLDRNGDGDFDDAGDFPPEDLDGNGVVDFDEIRWEVETDDPNLQPEFAWEPELAEGEQVNYRVVLQVQDDEGRLGYDAESVTVRVTLANNPPVAVPHPSGDPFRPYVVVPGQVIRLDGSASYDPDSDNAPNGPFPADRLTSLGWDLNLDGVPDTAQAATAFNVPVAWQPGETRLVRLTVCDDGRWAGQSDAECGGDCSLCTTRAARLLVVAPGDDP